MRHFLSLWFLLLFNLVALKGVEADAKSNLPLFFWHTKTIENFGDLLSLPLVERIVEEPVRVFKKNVKKNAKQEKKILGIGSILTFAANGDVIWGSGINGKYLDPSKYSFTNLDVRAVRGPLTRKFLAHHFQIESPKIYGDPALLFPFFFPEFKKQDHPSQKYIIIPHYSEEYLFPKVLYGNTVVYPTEPWETVVLKILDSQFVISSSLHGIIIAEAFGIPARLLRVTANEPMFKYYDYYYGTNRPNFLFATSIEEALKMGGEPPHECDLYKLYESFPFDLWPNVVIKPLSRE